MEEGYIKFHCRWTPAPPLDRAIWFEIKQCRERLHALGLIGAYPGGIGYGNISVRTEGSCFAITGSATGHLPELGPAHFAHVDDFDLETNSLTCSGPLKASSESLTHAAVYQASAETRVVIHVHHAGLWESLLHQVPTTRESAAYGTPEMAFEIERLFRDSDVAKLGILVMAGHREGILSFGATVAAAEGVLLQRLQDWKHGNGNPV